MMNSGLEKLAALLEQQAPALLCGHGENAAGNQEEQRVKE